MEKVGGEGWWKRLVEKSGRDRVVEKSGRKEWSRRLVEKVA